MPRFHLLFDYQNPLHPERRSSGEQVVVADTMDEAVRRIATERSLSSIRIRKRFFLGKPASEAEIIDKTFAIERA